MRTRLLVILGLCLLSMETVAQLDTKHWIPPFYAKPGPGTGTSNIRNHFVSLSTPATDTIPVSIYNGFGELLDIVEISRDLPMEYQLGPVGNANTEPATFPLNVIPEDSLNMPIRSQGLYFESFQPFFVNMRHKAGSQGTSLTSKGQVALGERFYSGHVYTRYNDDDVWNTERRNHFISVMATEDNTIVTIDMIKDPISYIGQTPGEDITVVLDAFESYVVGVDHSLYDDATINNANGTRITSDKPIVCNSGSWLAGNENGQCIGSDQLVPAEVTGQEYILVKGLGDESTERPIIVATEDDTNIFLNEDQTVPAANLDEGEFYIVDTDDFSADDNMYVLTDKKVYMFQTLSGSSTNIGPTVGLNFIPPLNCVGAKEVNLPFVNSLASGTGQGRINIITKAGTTIFVNDDTDPLTGASPVPGINDWVSYAFDPPSNNVNIVSDSVMNVALLTRDGVVGTAGYFSGFTLEPVVGLSTGISGTLPCIPGNAVLQVFGFDTYQWYFNGEEIEGETNSTLFPEFSGNYLVEGIDIACGFRFPSNEFSIPFCPSTLGAAKGVQNIEETADGSRIFDVTYRIFIENFSESPSQNIQVIENINGGLPVGATAQLIGTPSIAFGALSGGLNPNFDGVTDRALLPGNGGLPGSAADAIDLTIRVDMNGAEQDGYFNQVTVTSKNIGPNNGVDGPFNGQDFSHTGTNPDLNGNGEPNEEGENDPTLTCFFTNEIDYDEVAFCMSDGLQSVTVDGVSSGVFTADAPGLEIDPETGVINPGESEAGTYEVTFEVDGRCPTTTTTSVTIVAVPIPGEAVEETEVCFDQESIDLFDYIEGEEEGGVWTNANDEQVSEMFNFTIPGDFDFTYTIVSQPCAAEDVEVTINVIGVPLSGSPVDDLSVCVDAGEINLFDFIEGNQNGGQWFDGAMNPISETVNLESPGTLGFTYEVENDACGARSTSFEVTVVPESNPGVSVGESVVCRGEEVDLFEFLVDPDEGGVWTDADESEIDPLVNFDDLGPFTATYTVQSVPCEPASATVNIDVVQGPSAGNPQNPVLVCLGDPEFNLLELLPGATFGGQWEDEDGELIPGSFNPNTEGTYSFTYTVTSDDCGIITSDLIVDVSDENCTDLVIPQGFSPNGDGVGDVWIIESLSQYPGNQLLIYNRWGGQVFAATPYNNDWDGKPNQGGSSSSVLPVGTYFYILDLGDGSEPRKGYVYLNR